MNSGSCSKTTCNTLFDLSDIPDEEKNGEAADYNDDYEDDFNPTRYRY